MSFQTLERERTFKNPPKDGTSFPDLQKAVKPHVDSFNALTNAGLLNYAVKEIGEKCAFDSITQEEGGALKFGNKISFRVDEVQIAKPMLSSRERSSINRKVYPAEARERLTTYKSRLVLKFSWSVNGGPRQSEMREVGMIPIMVRSNRCHLEGLSPAELIAHKEESEEMGGYFIVNGIEKLIRMLILPKRNHPTAIIRPSFANRGTSYSQYGLSIRCVRPDQSSLTNTLHYLNNGVTMFRFHWRKNEYLIPSMMILKALLETSDKEIFEGIVGKDLGNTFLTDRVELMLRAYKSYGLYSQTETLQYLGSKFRVVLGVAEDLTDVEVGRFLLQKVVLVHLREAKDKFRLLLFMIRKLYALVAGECCADNPDSPQHQEILLGGFLYGQILKEKIEDWLNSIRAQINLDVRRSAPGVDFSDRKYLTRVFSKINNDIGTKLQYFLSTGNLVSNTGLDLQQATGYTVVAEKLNFYRFLSHFRMVHRGAFFAELKTTTVRKLLPEAWGFMCPVHTPDGSPCGLLNHLARKCEIVTHPSDVSQIPSLLLSLGVDPPSVVGHESGWGCVQLDGKIVGWCTYKLAKHVADVLRLMKIEYAVKLRNGTATEPAKVPLDLEIGYVPPSHNGQYPGLYLFSNPARMVRPVKHISTGELDMLGPFEQVYMDIACFPKEIVPKVSTHVEYSPTNVLSIVANMTPFSDFNQSPRNMYQCQMGKQTMGTPGTALRYRTDNKLYRLQTGQTPVVRPKLHNTYGLDHYPNGTNAVVAVISYTGYDMEDAMILNKSAHERGFGYGTVYKGESFDLSQKRRRGEPVVHHFGFAPGSTPRREWLQKLDADGLPFIGIKLEDGDPIVAYYDESTGQNFIETYHGTEPGFVDEVRLLGNDVGDSECQQIHVKLRITRSPIIGDKFSSRHGQKGICSQKWPTVDMPFTESGMQPDIIINPHAFPSRMTIGMFIESLAGKAGACHGLAQDSTPFIYSEQQTAADYFGEQLVKAGYNYHGNEPMYSGITGQEMKADIYIGVVYYQRLRHMVSDKFQVRTTGPIHNLTRQPVKGRKRAGGIRFGEMERDAVIGHGTSFLMQDRLMNCSDYAQSWVCRDCGSIISIMSTISMNGVGSASEVRCRSCAKPALGLEDTSDIWQDGSGKKFVGGTNTTLIALPSVFNYLTAELTAMNIKMMLEVK
ncbi:DNA-directed RNA polymerase I complex subunit Rpa2 [Schizosaccharomyces pombe]|uniref:Probable DNA-directed RNA polymerase I subunit RPA2 n=1 Tax=Schizosaccharomyces pombe (strain 972 / ATCC 24843) TaxID=284812 RepID=RPA2_SCHPO|nr:DNA-directed RNA polymerase I complex subunit Rpa2 [Schizosaccharomyces pombe]Q9P7X8.2 RecName: Full=Probable DNA-directed RNA polymerase I subunit RPA2; AltName: Full=DNA-directed RNA polymerase I polypeptide 2; Short=RNA polymerase I subunit 2 [Schizosaccharomyces pombe 972h-]7AOC_B Chain B, Probable DNA-directed RNA polymerase I subunit RPA2 [Schizosaccharomyces pombe 972h-]7AOD_B Chain B, Probable DNA-directed RNA polymerase I subunit RPA2 [Schizosaccharomyces pombe 972h-]7AOD_N Chain N,|eukprot:NP_595819.2 DNA-directed RNA polymerase I complex subunit Rpa2 [Schizosaccharomyces pombe]